jgi:hypothetical protein
LQFYAWNYLERYGDTISGYAETDLWSPDWYCGGVACWEEYISFASTTLYLGIDQMASYEDAQLNTLAAAWVYDDTGG